MAALSFINRQFNIHLKDCHRGSLIFIQNMLEAARQNRITIEKIDEEIETLISNLKIARERAIELIEETSVCEHDFDKATFTHERRVIGYSYVYRRKCKKCFYEEIISRHDAEIKSLPDWTIGAEQRYFNNSIY